MAVRYDFLVLAKVRTGPMRNWQPGSLTKYLGWLLVFFSSKFQEMWYSDIKCWTSWLFIPSEAFRGHQILLNHAKQKRKGCTFLSPASKLARKQDKQTLEPLITMFFTPCFFDNSSICNYTGCHMPISTSWFFLCITLLPPWISATLGRDLPWTLWTRCQWNLTFHNLNWKMSILTQVATHFYVKVSLGIAVWWCCLKIKFIFHSMGQHTGNVIKCPREWRTEPWKTWICCFVNNVLTTIHRSSSK